MIEKERIEELKRSIDLVALVESKGISLKSRGRNAGHPAPPAQIPACTTNALGSYLGYVTQSR
jgi:hypothetical protein